MSNIRTKLDYLSPYILPILLGIGDYLGILIAEKLTLSICYAIFPNSFGLTIPKLYFFIWIPAIFLFFLFYVGAHRRMIPFWEVIKNFFYASFYSTVASIFILYLMHRVNELSRLYVVLFFIISFILLCAIRQILVCICNHLDILKEPIIFIGANEVTETIIKFFKTNNCFGVRIIGIIDDKFNSDYLKQEFRLLKNLDEAKKYLEVSSVKTVIITIPNINQSKLAKIVVTIQPIIKNILFVPNIVGVPVANLDIKRLYTENVVLLNAKNNLASLRNKLIKRIFDIVMSLILCIPIIPIILLTCIWVKIDSKGPIFFNAKRIGKHGKTFTCYKFRSMYMNSDEILADYLAKNPKAKAEWDEFQKLHDFDPRVTKAGKIMRKTSLDELPQILNVLKGEMSLVGPRPYLPREIDKMGAYLPIIITTVPGITGYWQVNGRSDVTFEGRLKMDDWYIRNWSVWMDMVLLLKTIQAVFFSKGAV